MAINSATTKRFYHKLGVNGLENLTDDHRTKAMIAAVLPIISIHDRILDLGCGYGRIAIPLSKMGYRIDGIDFMPNFIAEAKLRAAHAGVSPSFKEGDMRKLPYADVSFNKVLSLWSCLPTILTLHDQMKVLNEVYRVLIPGGMAFIEMVNGEQSKYRQLLKKTGFGEDKRLVHENIHDLEDTLYYHDRASLRELCSQSNVKEYEVRFMNIGGQRRLVVFLYK